MNEQDNVNLIRKIYAAFAAGDAQTILDSVTITRNGSTTVRPASHTPDRARARRKSREFFQAIANSTTGGKVIAENFVAQGDTVVATGRYQATVRNTGAEIDTPIAHFFTVRNGKVEKWVGFSDSAQVADAHTGKAAAAR